MQVTGLHSKKHWVTGENSVTHTTAADPQYLTIAEIARDLRVSKMTAYRLVRTGRLFAIQINDRTLRVPTEAYQDYKHQLHADAVARMTPATPAPVPGQTTVPF